MHIWFELSPSSVDKIVIDKYSPLYNLKQKVSSAIFSFKNNKLMKMCKTHCVQLAF